VATGGRARTSARSTQYAPFLKDRKIAFIRLEGEGFGGTPLALEVRMSVEDSPSTAGNVLDAVRYLKCTMERGIAGIVDQEVIAQYSYTYDAQDAEGFAALFTEDAVWELFA
jgi:myo-inositol-1-phosphate synthase